MAPDRSHNQKEVVLMLGFRLTVTLRRGKLTITLEPW